MSDSTKFERRQLLVGATAAAVSTALPAMAAPQKAVGKGEATKLYALFDAFFDEDLTESPEQATNLGLDNGVHAGARTRLGDRSIAAWIKERREPAQRLARLKAVDRRALTGEDAVNYDTAAYYYGARDKASGFDYGAVSRPFVVTQFYGGYSSVPSFLDNKHEVKSAADADSYLERMAGFAGVLDQESERVRADAAKGVIPSDFILDKAIGQLKQFRALPPEKNVLVASMARRAKAYGDYDAKAAALLARAVHPALDRQIETLTAVRAKAVHEAGMNRFKDGDAFYAALLRIYTTTEKTPDEVHRLGLEEGAQIQARMDEILKKRGFTQGSVGQRMAALKDLPGESYPNTDEGRAQILAYCNRLIAEMQPKLPQWFGITPKIPVEVRRIPAYTENGSSGGYYERPPLDGSRPGAFYINLRDTAERPRYALPTLTYHEAAPGHHFQLALTAEGSLPRLRQNMFFSANTEGWALYAEQVAMEMGLYETDDLGLLGMYQARLFRASRCVVDTGIHAKGWSREKAIAYMVETGGDDEGRITREVERYCANPAQACSYKVGHTVWAALRERTKQRLGAKFDIRKYHDTALLVGPTPLTVLESVVDAWQG
ncbi:hypothetical protein AS593_17705 [Caulobacter vibrioides]|nr:hypothetical protein AS593_17705 [Caulobacter vibrioides]